MKKFLTLFATATMLAMAANAQDSSTPSGSTEVTEQSSGFEMKKPRFMRKDTSEEEKTRIEKRRAIMKSLTPEQKKEVKEEMKRHREVMKKFGFSDDSLPGGSKE